MTLQLRPYQQEAVDFLLDRRRAILGDQRGVGKTPPAIRAAIQAGASKVLVVTRRFSLGVWLEEVPKWSDYPVHLFDGTPKRRNAARDKFQREGGVLVTNYGAVPQLLTREVLREGYPVIILDEVHRIRNRAKTLFGPVKRLHSPYLFQLTGTPVVRSPADLWAYLHLIDPRRFSSFWNWVGDWFIVSDTGFGAEVWGLKDPPKFWAFMNRYMLRRTREVVPGLPDLTRQRVPLQMPPAQARVYNQIAEDFLAELPEGWLLVPNLVSQITRLRQVLVHPGLVNSDAPSVAVEAMTEHVRELGEPALVFCPFAEALPILKGELTHGRSPAVRQAGIIRGGMSVKSMQNVVKDFQESQEPSRVLLSQLDVAESWTATAGSVSYFLGLSSGWSKLAHEQAEGRMDRYGQKRPTLSHYLFHPGTVEEGQLQTINGRATLENLALNPRGLVYGQQSSN